MCLFQCAVQVSVSHSLSTRHAASISSILKTLTSLRSAKNSGQVAAIDNRLSRYGDPTPHPLLAFHKTLTLTCLFDESGTTSHGGHPDPNFPLCILPQAPSAAFVMGILAQWHHGSLETFDKGGGGGACSDYQPTMQSIQISERPKIRRFGAIFPEHRLHCPP